MTNYPDDLDDEALERLAEMFPETANDLKLWKRCNEIGKMFNMAINADKEEYEKIHPKRKKNDTSRRKGKRTI